MPYVKRAWVKRELMGEIELDSIGDGKKTVLKAFRKWWPDGSSCLDIIKYCRGADGDMAYWPTQHIQIPWNLSEPFLTPFVKLGDGA